MELHRIKPTMSVTRIVKGKITEITGGTHRIFAKNIEFNSKERIEYNAPQYTYGEPEEPPRYKNPKIVAIQFINENGIVLKNDNLAAFGGITATNLLYGKKLKIKLYTKEVVDGTEIEFELKGNAKDDSQQFPHIVHLSWALEILGNTCETDFFTLNPLWHSEHYEYYNYDTHRTEIKAEDLNTFHICGIIESRYFEMPENREDDLKPVAYLRNYEELLGLGNPDKAGEKVLVLNNENKFINYNRDIFVISRDFSGYLNYTPDLTLQDIKERIKTDAKLLWETAVKQVQGGHLDDRPLYWARTKMLLRLKRHPLFSNDLDYEKSIVKKDTELEKMIQLFEELSRNYTGIDFSRAGNRKQLLITGFDPFVLNDDPKAPDSVNYGNSLQSNPSGITALALHGLNIGYYHIQTFICPVRYKDFDEFKNGKGIIETFVQRFIQEADMIITVSQGGGFRFDVDRFPAKNRGGYMDNMLWGAKSDGYNEENFKQLVAGEEFYETTLPYEKIVPQKNNPSDTFWTYFNQSFLALKSGHAVKEVDDIEFRKKLSVIQKFKSLKGSGDDYLSNEIFYRVAKIRSEQRPHLATGHLHIPRIQEKFPKPYPRGNSSTKDINPCIKELIEQIKSTIVKV